MHAPGNAKSMRSSSLLAVKNPGVPFDAGFLHHLPELLPYEPATDLPTPTLRDARQITSFLDLTLLNSDDTPDRISVLLEAATAPLGQDDKAMVAAICIYPAFIHQAGTWLRAKGVKVATVAGAFPHGLSPLEARVKEVQLCARLADEVDIATPRYLALEERWEDLYIEIREMVAAAQDTPVKVILGTGELPDQETVYRAAATAMMAGAAFVKTSTGKERVNATLEAGATMAQAIKDYWNLTTHRVGLKPAGGIRTPNEAMRWIELVKERLGEKWLTQDSFRIGASSLLDHLRYL
jgi:deoxyribose-phosphate aldolase